MKNYLFLLFLMFNVAAYAIKVDGIVYDENKTPIIGASILVKSTKQGTITDMDGKFSLEISDVKNESLTISYIGYKTRHLPLKGRTVLTITLEPAIEELDEIVVVGYGTVRKSDLTGSVASVKTTADEAARATSFDKMLQGKAAGVVVSTGSSAPGGAVSVRIRGTNSLRGNNSPLYVVDGNIISDLGDTMNPMGDGTGAGNSRVDEQNPLTAISPQDIENIEILKDASATAIYGSQGANGVVLITTKKGISGKPTVAVSANATVSTLKKEIPMLNSYEYLEFANSFLDEGDQPLTMDGFTPVNWQKFSTRTAVSQNYRASISGKNNKTSYYLATGFSDLQGIIKQTNVSKYDLRVNLEQEFNKYISVKSNSFFSSFNTSMTSGTDKLANTRSSIVRHMISYKPLIGADPDAGMYDEDLTGPDAWFKDYDDDSEENMFNTNMTLDIKPLSWLTLRLKGGLVYRQKTRSMWYGTSLFNGAACNGKAGLSELGSKLYNGEALLMFDKKLNDHYLNGTVGVVYDKKNITQKSITGENFFSKDLRADGISQAGILYPYKYAQVGEQLFSVLARVVYSYKNRYVATGTFRADGSSKFEDDNKFSYFPSFALAWRINEEAFMRDITEISNLKLRAGWGQVGNQAISPYQTMASYENEIYTKPDGSAEPGIRPARIPNKDLKWETSEQYNVGVDLGLFNQRVIFTADAYIKKTKDLLQEIAIPYASGYQSMWVNNGKIENKGLEFSVETTPYVDKDWRWTVGGNISFTQNKILELGMAPSDFGQIKQIPGYYGENLGNGNDTKFPANIFLQNHAIGLFFGYQTAGIMQEDYYNSEKNQQKKLTINSDEILPGDVFFVDQNNDGEVDEKDRVILGDPNPDFVYAFNTTLSYKNLTLDLAFNGVAGNEIINGNLIDENDVSNSQKNVRKDAFYKSWTPENKSNDYPRLGYQSKGILTDRIIEDGSYLRLSHVSLSYNLNLKKTKAINSLTFTVTGSNLFTISSYSGYDPDVNTFANDMNRIGLDLASYPAARNFTFGIMANF